MENISIFFDTNIIESQFSCDKQNFLFHGEITPSRIFHEIMRFIIDSDLQRLTTFYIHAISWEEFNMHLRENYDNRIFDMKRYVEAYSKSFSSIVDIDYDIKNKTKDDYIEHINALGANFLSEYRCNIIDYPRDISLFESLVAKCLNKEKPFVKAKAAGKEYNDAGLKDALILETIVRHNQQSGDLCVFVSDDGDFSNITDIIVCKTADEVKVCVAKYFEVNDFTTIKTKIDTNDYLKEQIITNTGNPYNPEAPDFDFEIVNVSYADEGHSTYKIEIISTINETKYSIECLYDSVSNDFVNIQHKTEND